LSGREKSSEAANSEKRKKKKELNTKRWNRLATCSQTHRQDAYATGTKANERIEKELDKRKNYKNMDSQMDAWERTTTNILTTEH